MVFPVIGGDGKPTGYEISNSLRLTDNAYLNISRSSQSNTTGTFSAWIKTAAQNNFQFAGGHTDVNNRSYIYFPTSSGTGGLFSRTSGSLDIDFNTNAVYRDPSAWFHLVVAFDTTQSTESNRVKWYVNGEQITSFSASTYPSQNASIPILNKAAQTIGAGFGASAVSGWSDGYMAEVYYIDGTQYAASDFGETNDNGVWIPKDASGDLTFGTNGFYLEFKQTGTGTNASGMGADTSGNDNHLAVNNLAAIDVTTDTPTNNFATLNSLSNFEGSTLSEGNTKAVTPSSSTTPANKNGLVPATMGVQNGKWYWEVKVPTTNYVAVGIIADDKLDKDYLTGANSSTRIVKGHDGTKHSSNSAGGNYMAAYEGSILQVALNLDDGEITFGAGGSWANGSGSTNQTFANSTAAYTDLNTSSDFTNKFILPVVSDENQGTSDTFEMNFGNPPFAISSSNADANGYGNFEYAVPSGYYSLCTKNLAEYG